MAKSIIQEKSFSFAVDIIDLYKDLSSKHEYVLSKQIIRSGTSIGANISEALHSQTKKEFASKMHISRKEANETLYWLRLLNETGFISGSRYTELQTKCEDLQRILASIILTTRKNIPMQKGK